MARKDLTEVDVEDRKMWEPHFLGLKNNYCIWEKTSTRNLLFEVKISLGSLSKTFVRIELDWRVTLGTITLVPVKSARVTAIWIGGRYMR